MVTISNIAQRILDENNYSTDDVSITNLEYMIDNAIDYINSETGRTIAHVSSNDLTADYDEIMVVKTLAALMIRARKDRGPLTTNPGISVASLTSDPQYKLFMQMINRSLNRLRGRSFERT